MKADSDDAWMGSEGIEQNIGKMFIEGQENPSLPPRPWTG
jgi:hypothetical protein